MAIEVTPEAADVLRRSLEGSRGAATAIRLRAGRGLGGGRDVQVELADDPRPDEAVVELEGVTLFVDPEVARAYPSAVVAVEAPHDVIVVRSGGKDS
jgi:Fe-S cluster assembly iron-binding protein IscA